MLKVRPAQERERLPRPPFLRPAKYSEATVMSGNALVSTIIVRAKHSFFSRTQTYRALTSGGTTIAMEMFQEKWCTIILNLATHRSRGW